MSEHTSDAQSHTHRYGASGAGSATGQPNAGPPTPGQPPAGSGHHGQPGPGYHPGLGSPLPPGQTGVLTPPAPRRGPGIVIAAVLAGALAGTGGAAGYAAITDDSPSTTPGATSLDTTPVSSSTKNGQAVDGDVEQVAAAVQPSVVQINTAGAQGAGNGTGIIISEAGEILTNNHVVESAANGGSITVIFDDGTTADATIVGRDPVTDVAVIQAEDVSDLQPAALGSSDDLQVGEEVVAIGSPFGLESTVTSGIVSALNRPVTASSGGMTESTVFPAIQTDAAINPGNSGGPLVNLNGQVIGINSAIYGQSGGSIGLGFAIPIDLARSIAKQLVDGEDPTHARIGITVTDAVESDQITTVGAQVEGVTDGSAGEEAGLEDGDIVTAVDSHRVTSANGLIALIRSYRPGDEVTLSYLRDGDEHEADVTLDSDEGDLTS